MKKIIYVLMAATLSTGMVFADSESLDGKSYCRTIVSDGMFGQPKGEREHCLSFFDGTVTDNANTFFGNPPEIFPYTVDGFEVNFDSSTYKLSANNQILITVDGSTVKGTLFCLKK